MRKDDIAVIVPVWENPIGLQVALQSVQDVGQIIVVDDGSVVHRAEHVELCAGCCYLYLDPIFTAPLTKKRGDMNARRVGVSKVRGDWIFFLDSDMVVGEDFFDKLIACTDVVELPFALFPTISENGILRPHDLDTMVRLVEVERFWDLSISVLFHKSLLNLNDGGLFDCKFQMLGELAIALWFYRAGVSVYSANAVVYHNRVRCDSNCPCRKYSLDFMGLRETLCYLLEKYFLSGAGLLGKGLMMPSSLVRFQTELERKLKDCE